MRRSKEATAESRRKITETASRLFRERGVERVGVADVMQAAGMTHGGFYRHFPSKDALVAEAMAHAFGELTARLVPVAAPDHAKGLSAQLGAYVQDYLSAKHVAHPEKGCPMAAAGSEARHAGADVGVAFAQGAGRWAELLTQALAENSPAPREAALRLLSSLVGAIVVARAVGEGALQDEVIAAMRADPLIDRVLKASST